MDDFSAHGQWWLPGRKQSKQPGEIRFSRGEGCRLQLFGSGILPADLNVIHGKLDNGKLVTLAEPFSLDGSPFSSVLGSSVFHSNIGIEGANVKTVDALPVSKFRLNYSSLFAWSCAHPFKVKSHKSGGAVTVKKPKALTLLDQNNIKAELIFEFGGFPCGLGLARTSANVEARIIGDARKGTTLGDVVSIANSIQDFLSFASSSPTRLEIIQVQLSSSTQANWLRPLFAPIGPESSVVQLSPNMLLPLTTMRRSAPKYIGRWIEMRERLSPECGLFFDSLYHPPSSLHSRFFSLVQVLEGLHRNDNKSKQCVLKPVDHKSMIKRILTQVSSEDADWFQSKLNHSNEPSLAKRIESLYGEFADLMNELTSVKIFLKAISNTRNALAHMTRQKDLIRGESLYVLCEQMSVLVELILLREIGLSADSIDARIRETPRYRSLGRRWLNSNPKRLN